MAEDVAGLVEAVDQSKSGQPIGGTPSSASQSPRPRQRAGGDEPCTSVRTTLTPKGSIDYSASPPSSATTSWLLMVPIVLNLRAIPKTQDRSPGRVYELQSGRHINDYLHLLPK